jgi:hypothetical protein
MDRKLRRDLNFATDDAGPFSVAGDEFAYQDMSRVPALVQKHEDLQQREHTTKELQAEQWMHLLGLAEDVFIKDEILGLAKENGEEEEPEPSGPGPEDLEREGPQKSRSEVRKDSSPEKLQLALEVCRRARDDFEDARKFSQEEIEQLPQPVTEKILGVAKALKLAHLTHALYTAEEEYSDARRAARDAGIAKPQEQTADFSNQSDDGYDTALIEKAVFQASERVSRVQG